MGQVIQSGRLLVIMFNGFMDKGISEIRMCNLSEVYVFWKNKWVSFFSPYVCKIIFVLVTGGLRKMVQQD